MSSLANLLGRAGTTRLGAALTLAAGLAVARLPAHASTASAPAIRIESFRFVPAELVVAKGTTVTWVNRDQELHSVAGADGTFASPGLDTEDRYAHRFDAPGRYEYRCALHPHMQGVIVVR